MNNDTNPANSTPENRHPYGVGYTAVTCPGGHTESFHTPGQGTFNLMPGVTCNAVSQPVRTVKANNGMVIRRFGLITYWPATGQMHITQRAGAMPSEISSLIATAETPRQDPETWPVHPCNPEQRRIGLYRPVDEHYLAEAEAAMFGDLERTEQTDVVNAWAEGLTNV